MLRDLSELTASGAGICGTHLAGVPLSEMPTGFPQPGLLNNDVDAADPAGCLYRVEIIDKPTAGVLTVQENGAFSFTGAPDGVYAGATKVYKNGAADNGSYSFTIGNPVVPNVPAPSFTSSRKRRGRSRARR